MTRNIDILFKLKSYLKIKDQVKRSLGFSLLKINLKIAILLHGKARSSVRVLQWKIKPKFAQNLWEQHPLKSLILLSDVKTTSILNQGMGFLP